MMELDAFEADILDSVENGEWRSASNFDEQRNDLLKAAAATPARTSTALPDRGRQRAP